MTTEDRPKWHCSVCGSYNVESIENARFDPNNDHVFVESCEIHVMDWCNVCNSETILNECEVKYKDWIDRHNTMMRDPNNE